MSGFSDVVAALRYTFQSGRTKNLEWRRNQLHALVNAIESNRNVICQAINADLRKSKFEASLMEIENVLTEARSALLNLEAWAKPTKRQRTFLSMMNEVYTEPEPLGVSLIIGAWNFPFMLCLSPLVSAIAAGNCAIIKPSELSPTTATCIEKLIKDSLDEDTFRVINGDASVSKDLLACRFDKIFFTGSPRIGKIILEAAAKHLTPVTLELGGKCPVFVDKDTDLNIVANRVLWAKTSNCGQVCLAPDYIITTRDVQADLVKAFRKTLNEMYGSDISRNRDYPRIVNDAHFKRLQAVLRSCEPKIVYGGKFDASDRFMEPTIVADVTKDDVVMQDEIFGPILPILTVDNFDDAISYINNHEKPLALYMFTNKKELIDLFRHSTSSGAFAVNDCLMQAAVPSLPFGGVGNSGMGAYHGKYGFDAFSHEKACYVAPLAMESFNAVRYAPFSDEKLSVITFLAESENCAPWLARPLVWMYMFVVFLVRLATLPKRRPNAD